MHSRPPRSKRGRLLLTIRPGKWRSRWDLHPHSSRRQRAAFLFSYESEMVGSAGPHFATRTSPMGRLICGGTGSSNAPVRHFQFCFLTLDLKSSNWIASHEIGSGSGSCTHLSKFMRLRSVLWSSFPQKWWRSAGNAPASACKAGASLFCHAPKKLAGCLRAGRSKLSFGNSAAC